MLFVMALMAGATAPSVGDKLSRMTRLYDEVCLRAFPDDKAVEAIMTARQARPLTADEVKVTMRDDPARGWELQDESATVWVEFPPYHACSVRWNSPQMPDFREYRDIADHYQHAVGGFSPLDPYDADVGDIHVHATGEQRPLPGNATESLFIFDQHITDAKRRAAGDTGFVLRFVHQLYSPEAK